MNIQSNIALMLFNGLFITIIFQLNGSFAKKNCLLALGNVLVSLTFWRPKDNGPRQIKSFKLAYTGPLFPENEMKLEKAQVIKLSSALTLLPNLEV